MIAREMILSMGMGRKMGPVDLMHVASTAKDDGMLLRTADSAAPSEQYFYHATDMSTEQSRVAMAEVVELLEAGEAKAYYGLAVNWKPLQALIQALLNRGVLQGKEVSQILESNGVIHFPSPFTAGYGWEGAGGTLKYPHKPAREPSAIESQDDRALSSQQATLALTGAKAKTWFAGTQMDAPRNPDGSFKHGWHWNMPYSYKRDLPEWYKKEMERYEGEPGKEFPADESTDKPKIE